MSIFTIGQTVHHRMFDYRGVITGVDQSFQGSDDWYDQVAQSRPPKDKPWYHVLVHDASHRTYVAERHLDSLICFETVSTATLCGTEEACSSCGTEVVCLWHGWIDERRQNFLAICL